MKSLVRLCYKVAEKSLCLMLFLVITPCFFIFEMTVVRPIIVKNYNIGVIKHTLHIVWSVFCFTNIIGNMVFSVFIDTKVNISKVSDSFSYCEQCKMHRPPQAWHCKTCNACILRRDHHCFFLSSCIGLRNQRYFVTYLGYILISLLYSFYYNFYYVLTKFEDYSFIMIAIKIVNPFIRYLLPEQTGIRDMYVYFLFLNMGLAIWSSILFAFHMSNVLNGVTARDYRKGRNLGVDWSTKRRNFIRVFGTKWYWAVLTPFADSPLPEIDENIKLE